MTCNVHTTYLYDVGTRNDELCSYMKLYKTVNLIQHTLSSIINDNISYYNNYDFWITAGNNFYG